MSNGAPRYKRREAKIKHLQARIARLRHDNKVATAAVNAVIAALEAEIAALEAKNQEVKK